MEQHSESQDIKQRNTAGESHGVGNGAAPKTASPRAARKGGDKVDRMGTGSIPKLIV